MTYRKWLKSLIKKPSILGFIGFVKRPSTETWFGVVVSSGFLGLGLAWGITVHIYLLLLLGLIPSILIMLHGWYREGTTKTILF
jgi:hypothetical protein